MPKSLKLVNFYGAIQQIKVASFLGGHGV